MTVHTDLNDQVILVTGASRGLGRHLCRHFAGLGMRVAAVARTEGELLELKSEVEKDGGIVLPFPASVCDYDGMQDVVNRIVEEWGSIDVLINNAGVHRYEPLEEMTKEMIDYVLDINLKGTIYTTRVVAPVMMEAKSGHIINITSTSAKRGLSWTGLCGFKAWPGRLCGLHVQVPDQTQYSRRHALSRRYGHYLLAGRERTRWKAS